MSDAEIALEASGHIASSNANPTVALKRMLDIMSEVPPEDRQRLLQSLATFFDLTPIANPATPSASASRKRDGIPFSEERVISPKEFLFQKRPQSDVERVTALAYYLTHYRDTPHFKTLDISKLNTEAAQAKFSNAAKSVDNATNYGYLAQATKGNKQLSAGGELFIEALPNRDAAKEAMQNARPKRRAKRNSQLKEKYPNDVSEAN